LDSCISHLTPLPPVIYTWSRRQSFSFSKSTSSPPTVIYFRSQSYSFMWLAPFSNSAVSCAETAEQIEIQFGLWTRVDRRKKVLDGGSHCPMGTGNFNAEKRRPIVKYSDAMPWAVQKTAEPKSWDAVWELDSGGRKEAWQILLNSLCVAAMCPFCQITLIICYNSFIKKKKFLHYNYKCGPMPNVMAALPNISGVLCSTPESLADAHY